MKDLFEQETFGGNGRTCRTCHSEENGTITPSQANVEREWIIDAARDGFGGVDDVELTLPDLGKALITGDPADIALFKIPTLRNIRHTQPYFRDGSAATLEDVVNHYQRFINAVGDICDTRTGDCEVTDQDKSDIVEFLQLL